VNAFLASSYGRPAFCRTNRLVGPPPPSSRAAGRAAPPWLGAAVLTGLGAALFARV
jgi:hypothetical protein